VYEFTADGIAVWPDTTFSYKIGTDPVFVLCDNFFIGKTNAERRRENYRRYGFEWESNRLKLFTTTEDVDIDPYLHPAAEPFAILTPVAG
jgi:hypothetical protein